MSTETDARIAELERERDRIIGLQQELSCKNATIETFHRGVLDAHKENERLKERIAELERERDDDAEMRQKAHMVTARRLADAERRIAELERGIIHPNPALWDRLRPPARQP
jgi:predicted RNase H-like nuclease (RuvC/YqgF family)